MQNTDRHLNFQIDTAFTASIENKICPLTIAAFIKFHSDPEILNLCQDIFKELSEIPDCVGPLQTRLVPTLISMMNVTLMDKSKDGIFYPLIILSFQQSLILVKMSICVSIYMNI